MLHGNLLSLRTMQCLSDSWHELKVCVDGLVISTFATGLSNDYERLQRWSQQTIWKAFTSDNAEAVISSTNLQAISHNPLRAYLTFLLHELSKAGEAFMWLCFLASSH